jgi:hypothetical protein
MDDDLRQKFAPRRNKRYPRLRRFNEEAKWARGLDWRTNEYDFHRLARSVLDALDSEYREKWGVRVDQLAELEEIQNCLQMCRSWYAEEDALFREAGVYVFLRLMMDLWFGGKICDVLDRRRVRRVFDF